MTTETKATRTPGPWVHNALPANGDLRESPACAIWSADSKTTIVTTEFGSAFNKTMPDDATKDANIRFIVRACNAHDDLIAACKLVLKNSHGVAPLLDEEHAIVAAAVSKAEGRVVS
jgi:hypothetical protein